MVDSKGIFLTEGDDWPAFSQIGFSQLGYDELNSKSEKYGMFLAVADKIQQIQQVNINYVSLPTQCIISPTQAQIEREEFIVIFEFKPNSTKSELKQW